MSSRERMIVRLSKPHLPIQFRYLNEVVSIDPAIGQETGDSASRAAVAQALNLLLLADLLERTPTAAAYVEDLYNEDHKLVFDHGALRTVDVAGMGTLPPGRHPIARVLEPLGYTQTAIYPLDRLGMTGFSYTHSDFPESLPQFFVSELHAGRFSPAFQRALLRVTEQSEDPLDPIALERLDRLASAGELPLLDALALLPALVACFDRQHCGVRLEDYETLLAESAEAAWIATEGNSFNHATNRVANLKKVVAEQRLRGRPIKPNIEVSRSARVHQTAYVADPVQRRFIGRDAQPTTRTVPGSFFEFIERGAIRDQASGEQRLDLAFDSSNAQAIFKMTAA